MSTIQKTLVIIKPDAVSAGHTESILRMINDLEGVKVIDSKRVLLTREQVEQHYAEHREKPFFAPTVEFMTSGEVVTVIVQGRDAIARVRKLAGATNPANAEEGTIRYLFAKSIDANAIHTSDSPESAAREIALFFPERAQKAA